MHITEVSLILFFATSFCLAWRQLIETNHYRGNVHGIIVQKADTVKWHYNHFDTKLIPQFLVITRVFGEGILRDPSTSISVGE